MRNGDPEMHGQGSTGNEEWGTADEKREEQGQSCTSGTSEGWGMGAYVLPVILSDLAVAPPAPEGFVADHDRT